MSGYAKPAARSREPQGEPSVVFACAMTVEERIARRFGPTAVVGLGATNGIPAGGRLVSFGIAGALRDGVPIGTVIDATRVVDEAGAVLWEGGPLGVAPARTGTILGASRIVDDPAERARLHAETGADAVDMESGPLARSGRLAGCIRAISDTPTRRLGGVAQGAKPTGELDPVGFVRGFLREPVVTARAALGARRALKSLEALA
jgi:adenosylhomocysteine nucleosidase